MRGLFIGDTFFNKHRVFTWRPRVCMAADIPGYWSVWWLWFEVSHVPGHADPRKTVGAYAREFRDRLIGRRDPRLDPRSGDKLRDDRGGTITVEGVEPGDPPFVFYTWDNGSSNHRSKLSLGLWRVRMCDAIEVRP